MNIIFYFAFIGFGFGAAFALDKILRAVKLIWKNYKILIDSPYKSYSSAKLIFASTNLPI